MFQRKLGGVMAAVALVAAACGGGGASQVPTAGAGTPGPGTSGPASAAPTTAAGIGEGEGELNLVIWGGYAERGATDPAFDWVTPFEDATGCMVSTTDMTDSNNGVALMQGGQYDGISASGDATTRLIQGGTVAAIDTSILPNYANVFDGLKDLPHNTIDGVNYGVPHGRGANLLMWRTDEVTTAPTKWAELFDPASPYAGKFSVYDAPIYIADAAVVLMKSRPELNIKNPYSLDETQLQAAIDLLTAQKPAVGDYWGDYTKQIDSFTNGNTVLGTTWQVIANVLQGSDVPVEVVKPEEGATGWSDTWMINSKTAVPNCAYMFVNHITSAPINIQIAEYFGEAPGNSKSCALASNPEHCDIFHAEETDYWTDVWYWTTPTAKCLDGRTDVTCTDFARWVEAWTAIRSN
jgi:putative spermidine/putrescine transport system substrate-binding protein